MRGSNYISYPDTIGDFLYPLPDENNHNHNDRIRSYTWPYGTSCHATSYNIHCFSRFIVGIDIDSNFLPIKDFSQNFCLQYYFYFICTCWLTSSILNDSACVCNISTHFNFNFLFTATNARSAVTTCRPRTPYSNDASSRHRSTTRHR